MKEMIQQHSGFALDSIHQLFKDHPLSDKYRKLLSYLSCFEVYTPDLLSKVFSSNNSIFAVASNLISRGLPTLCSIYVEEQLLLAFKNQTGRSFSEIKDKEELIQAIFKTFHIIDPRLKKEILVDNELNTFQSTENQYEQAFYSQIAPSQLGDIFLQIFERGRNLENLVKLSENPQTGIEDFIVGAKKQFTSYALDFSTEFPYLIDGTKGFVVEIDDKEHDKIEQRDIDRIRENAIEKSGWMLPFRYRTIEWTSIATKMKPLRKAVNNEYFAHLADNFIHPLYESVEGLALMNILLSPFAIARIQKSIIDLLIAGKISLADNEWKIGVVERDVPCAWLAISDLLQLFNQLLILQTGKPKNQLPDIKLTVFNSPEFKDAALNVSSNDSKFISQFRVIPIEKFSEFLTFDILLDVSVLQRSGVPTPEIKTNSQILVIIRSVQSIKSKIGYDSAPFVNYNTPVNLYQEESLRYFLRNIYRKENFKPAQKEIIFNNLNPSNLLINLPPAEGKTIACQLVSLLQPGISLIVVPSYIVYVDQQFELSENRIDAFGYYNSLVKKEHEILFQTEKITQAQQLFIYISPETLQIDTFRQSLQIANDQSVGFTSVVIEEAHCLTENSHDFMTSYLQIGKNSKSCKTFEGKPCAVLAITSTASYDTIEDIQNEFQISEDQIITRDFNFGRFDFEIMDIKCNNVFYNSPELSAKSTIASKKQVSINILTKKLYFPAGEVPETFQTQMFCPHKGWMFGVSDVNNDGLADKLTYTYPKLNIGTFTGTSNDRFDQETKSNSERSLQNFSAYKKGQNHILACTKSAGVGISAPYAKYTLFVNMPSSVEAFIQMCGRIAGSSESPKCTVLYNKQQMQFSVDREQIFANGTEQIMIGDIGSTVDKEIAKESHYQHFIGKIREKAVLNELLTNIIQPSETPIILLTNILWEEFGEMVEINLYPLKTPSQIHVNQNGKTFGYLDYNSFTNVVDNSSYDKNYSDQLLNFVRSFIELKCPKNIDIFKWLQNTSENTLLPGIELILNGLEIGASADVIIPLQNDLTFKIADLLSQNVSLLFKELQIRELHATSKGFSDFVLGLNQIANVDIAVNSKKIIDDVRILYYQIRNEQDTFRAIGRLCVLGIVDNFAIDFVERQIKVRILKNDFETSKQTLIAYFQRYISKAATDKFVNELLKTETEQNLRSLLNVLLQFVYVFQANRSLQRIDDMDKLCELGSRDNQHPEFVSIKIKDFLKLYLKARYAGTFTTPNLLTETQNLSHFSIQSVWKFIQEVGELKDNWKHLRASTEYLLALSPNNYVLLLLNAYSVFLLESDNEESFKGAFNTMIQGFYLLKADEKDGYLSYVNQINSFLAKLYERKPNLEETIRPLLYLKIHSAWLAEFNKRFLNKEIVII